MKLTLAEMLFSCVLAVTISFVASEEMFQCNIEPTQEMVDSLEELSHHVELIQAQLDAQPSVTWADEVAQATCTGMMDTSGLMFAVRRGCTQWNQDTCEDICTAQGMTCANALHVYKSSHPLDNDIADGVSGQPVIKARNFESCLTPNCGPNFCCCVDAS